MPTIPAENNATDSLTSIEVRYAETDQMGIVHHANYVVWFELARTDQCKSSGYHYSELEAMGFFLVVTGVEVRYRQPARYGDTIQIRCHVDRVTSRGMTFGYKVLRDDTLLVDGVTHHIWVDAESRRPVRTPEVVRDAFRRLAGVEV
ncbi:MAG: thioesterase family protein [Acidobacteriota bacterium]